MSTETAPSNEPQLTNNSTRKIAVVTGATGGMGRKIVADLAQDHTVYALGRDKALLDELVTSHGDAVVAVPGDLTEIMTSDQPLSETPLAPLADLGQIHTVVHAAAIAQNFSVADAEYTDWQAHFDINVTVPAWLTRELLPALRLGEATVIFINSGAGRATSGNNVVYCASKHALYALADGLRKSEHGIRVSSVSPGPTDTAMFKGLAGEYNPDHVIAPDEVAKAIRAVVDAGPTTQLTEIQVRPRIELAERMNNS